MNAPRVTWFATLFALACAPVVDSGQWSTDTAQRAARNAEEVHPLRTVVAVELEPTRAFHSPASMEWPFQYFEDLVLMVEAATAAGHGLTLLPTPQWQFWVQDPGCRLPESHSQANDRVGECAEWWNDLPARGHEIGWHHHGLLFSPTTWDGYTDLDQWAADRDRDGQLEIYGQPPLPPDPYLLGSLDDFLDVVEPASEPVHSISTNEWVEGTAAELVVSAGSEPWQSLDEPGDLVGALCADAMSSSQGQAEVHLWRLQARSMGPEHWQFQQVLDQEIEPALRVHGATGVEGFMAVKLHARDADLAGPMVLELFDLLADHGAWSHSAAEVMAQTSYADVPPWAARPSQRCAD